MPLSRKVHLVEAPTSLPEHKKARPKPLTYDIQVVTPVFGGGVNPGMSDKDDPFRAQAIRGHLRFWWRATKGAAFPNVHEMLQKEQEIWGGTSYSLQENGKGKNKSLRSMVEVEVVEYNNGEIFNLPRGVTEEGYALFPTRGKNHSNVFKEANFRLQLNCPLNIRNEVYSALWAWTTFGGYGSCTRRSIGALHLVNPPLENDFLWFPPSRNGMIDWVNSIPLQTVQCNGFPILYGSTIAWLSEKDKAIDAWKAILKIYMNFRQNRPLRDDQMLGTCCPHAELSRPGRSLWPEPDKIRHSSGTWAVLPYNHRPKFGPTPYYPRAQLGLPIQFQFQQKSRCPELDEAGNPVEEMGQIVYKMFDPPEPAKHTLQWCIGGALQSRWASPLILNVIRCSNGKWLPVALWLNSPYPPGEITLVKNGREVHGSRAKFDASDPDVIEQSSENEKENTRKLFFSRFMNLTKFEGEKE